MYLLPAIRSSLHYFEKNKENIGRFKYKKKNHRDLAICAREAWLTFASVEVGHLLFSKKTHFTDI